MARALFLSLSTFAIGGAFVLVACGDSSFTSGDSDGGAATNDASVADDSGSTDDGGIGHSDGSTAIDAGPVTTSDGGIKLVFITGDTYTGGQVESVVAANTKCKGLAIAGGLPSSRDFHAWLSSTIQTADGNVTGNGPWYLRDGTTLVFKNHDSLEGAPEHAIDQTQSGVMVQASDHAWTGSNSGGILIPGSACMDWSSSGSSGTATGEIGDLGKDSTWGSAAAVLCTVPNHLICFEQ